MMRAIRRVWICAAWLTAVHLLAAAEPRIAERPDSIDRALERSLAPDPDDVDPAVADNDVELSDADPLGGVTEDMADVCEELMSLSTGEVPQQTQRTIVSKLDKIIDMLEQECAKCRGGGSGANPNKPLADSAIIGGPGGSGDLHAERSAGKDWAQLPAKERERIMQSLTEGFPAHYQRILERYYKRLAEENPVDSAPSEVAPSQVAPSQVAPSGDSPIKTEEDGSADSTVSEPRTGIPAAGSGP
jgi:hypothetical protein